jgi:AcrR family transcriptional regulator
MQGSRIAAQPIEPVEARVLEIACAHVRKFGPAHTTVVGIAREAGMTHANVYRYFLSKEALFDEMTAFWLRPLEKTLREAANCADSASEKLERMLVTIHRAYRQKLESDAPLFDLFVEALEKSKACTRRHRARLQADFLQVVEEGIASRSFATNDRRAALSLIFDTAHRFIHPLAMRSDAQVPTDALEARLQRTIDLILHTLKSGRM